LPLKRDIFQFCKKSIANLKPENLLKNKPKKIATIPTLLRFKTLTRFFPHFPSSFGILLRLKNPLEHAFFSFSKNKKFAAKTANFSTFPAQLLEGFAVNKFRWTTLFSAFAKTKICR